MLSLWFTRFSLVTGRGQTSRPRGKHAVKFTRVCAHSVAGRISTAVFCIFQNYFWKLLQRGSYRVQGNELAWKSGRVCFFSSAGEGGGSWHRNNDGLTAHLVCIQKYNRLEPAWSSLFISFVLLKKKNKERRERIKWNLFNKELPRTNLKWMNSQCTKATFLRKKKLSVINY